MVLLQRKLYFSKDPEGVQNFPGGGGPKFFLMLISKETHITCDFPGDPNPPPPLSIRTCLRMRGRKSQRFHRIFIRRISW